MKTFQDIDLKTSMNWTGPKGTNQILLWPNLPQKMAVEARQEMQTLNDSRKDTW